MLNQIQYLLIHFFLYLFTSRGLNAARVAAILSVEQREKMTKATRDTHVTRFSRQDVLRILHVKPRQIAAWERAGLVSVRAYYTFEHLSQLRTLRDLRAPRLTLARISASVAAMQRVAGVRNALGESSAVGRGSRVVFRHRGALLDPLTQQLSFDFAADAGATRQMESAGKEGGRGDQVQEMFLRAVRLEEQAKTLPEAEALYEAILAQQPRHAASSINLGTIRYNQRNFVAAERLYRQATEADPEYALAFFDLGNVLDELREVEGAISAYNRAIALVPEYADAHYNLALAYERRGDRRRALQHWLTYVRLDPAGPWSVHARGRARSILSSERLRIVSRRGTLIAAG